MDSDNIDAMSAVLLSIIGYATILILKKRKSRRRWWTRPWIMKRNERGALRLINEEFSKCKDYDSYKNFLRMDRNSFFKLLSLIKDDIEKETTLMRETISPQNRLIISLRFLATGESYKSVHFTFRVGHKTISKIVPEVCQAIKKNLYGSYLKTPTTTAEWLNIAEKFYNKWNSPNTLGAMDGKHIVFEAPRSAGSVYYNYKQQNSIVLLAVADASYRFTYIDCGTNGRVSDGGVFQKSTLAHAIENNTLNFPEWRSLPDRNVPVPFVLLADAAFSLKSNILKPFPFRNMTWNQRVFNYRLSRAQRVIENSFGILANRWRVLLTKIILSPEKVQLITETCCILHNFLLTEHPIDGEPEIDPEFRFIYGLAQQGGNRVRAEALNIRNEFMLFFNNEGAVPWQNDIA